VGTAICTFAYLRICVVDAPTKPPRKQRKYRSHRPMENGPKGSFVNLCICVQSNKITALVLLAVYGEGRKFPSSPGHCLNRIIEN
jgi:hypothetical protein